MNIIDELLLELQEFSVFYCLYMRPSMFTAFVTMGSFLLTAKVFLIVNMRSIVSDEKYKDLVRLYNQQLPGNAAKAIETEPLHTLAATFSTNIIWAFATSTCQFSIGLIPHWSTTVICVVMAIITMTLTFKSVARLKKWVSMLLKHQQQQIDAAKPTQK